jgi:hypothetical protein
VVFCQLRLGDTAAAAETFQKGLTVPTTHGVMNRPSFLVGAALAALAQGNLDREDDVVREARQLVDSAGTMHLLAAVGIAEGLVSIERKDDKHAAQ